MEDENITVIIPTHNRRDRIGDCIHSVLSQTVLPREIIVVDDGSDDDTNVVLEQFGSNITVIHHNNRQGAQAARNTGLKSATSRWITFLDSDDVWMPNKIERQMQELEKIEFDPWTVIHCDCFIIDQSKPEEKVWELPLTQGHNVLKLLLTRPAPMFQGILTSQLAMKKIGVLDTNLPSYQEWDVSIQLAKYCRFIHIREPLFKYTLHSGETISRNSKSSISGYQRIIMKHRANIIQLCGHHIFDQHIINNAVRAMNAQRFEIAKDILSSAIKVNWKVLILKILNFLHVRPIRLLRIRTLQLRGIL
jgi:glycosyltransferase involved in cell wall biosynthesis